MANRTKTPLEQVQMRGNAEVFNFMTLQRTPEKDLSLIIRPQNINKQGTIKQ